MTFLPYPRRPPNSFHRTHSKFVCASPPTEFTEFTEASGGGYSPTDFTEYTEASGGEEPPTDCTDVHRFFFSASRFCVFREFCGKIVLWLPYPRRPPNSFHRTHSKFVCVSPPTELTEFTEISGGGYSPTDFTEYTEASGGEEPPTDFTDVHRFFFSASRFCVFREFCGKIVWWLRGYGRMPYPPNLCISVQSVGEYLAPETSVGSVASVER